MAIDISIQSLLILLIPIILIIFILRHLKISKGRKLVESVFRMFLQLSMVGIYLQYLFEFNFWLVNILYFIIMCTVASFSVIKSTNLNLKRIFTPLFISITSVSFITLLFFNGVIIRLDNIFEAKYIITIGGMLLGNILNSCIVSINFFYNEIRKNETSYLYLLSMGATKIEATKHLLRESLQLTINPAIASMSSIGIVSLPGMMTGQILGGSLPITAIKYQIAIMVAIFIVKFFAVYLGIILSMKTTFNEMDCLRSDVFID